MALGILDDIEFTQQELILNPGDGVMLYTDGVTEAMNTDDRLFSDQRLLELLQDKPGRNADELVETVITAVRAHVGEAEQSDDITIMAVRRAANE